jgi:predicted metal-dependent hydrolase
MDPTSSARLMESLNRDAERIALQFGLRYKSIGAERANVTRRYGVCFSDGVIRIRLRHAVTGRPLKYSSLVNTLCHELAHLRHFDHGARFERLYRRILEYARRHGVYRPNSPSRWQIVAIEPPVRVSAPPPQVRAPQVPVQLELF